MKRLQLVWTAQALADLRGAWQLVANNDGAGRADGLTAKIETFCHRLTTIPKIGTRHDDRLRGLRSVGVPGLRRAMVLFKETADTVIVVRIGYLGRNVCPSIPSEVEKI